MWRLKTPYRLHKTEPQQRVSSKPHEPADVAEHMDDHMAFPNYSPIGVAKYFVRVGVIHDI